MEINIYLDFDTIYLRHDLFVMHSEHASYQTYYLKVHSMRPKGWKSEIGIKGWHRTVKKLIELQMSKLLLFTVICKYILLLFLHLIIFLFSHES